LQAAGDRATQAQRRILALALAGGMAVGLILLSVETAFDFPLYRAVMGSSDPRLADMVEAKRSVDALPLLAWPDALALARLGKTWLAVVLLAVFTVASFKWTASSATLAMLASLVLLGLAFLSVKAVRRALMGATILAFLLIVPFAIVAYDAGSTTAGFLKHSAQHRFEIWHFAAEKILERPLFGYGFNSSRHIPNGTAVSAFLEPGKPIIPLHPHDGFLQIWLELGAVGAVLSAIALLATLRATAKWPDRSSRFALPGYAAALIVAGLAFGIWQTWWMATLAFSAIAFTTLAPGPDYA
jgi:O-antigen ligase